jgi:WD40 repeat protein
MVGEPLKMSQIRLVRGCLAIVFSAFLLIGAAARALAADDAHPVITIEAGAHLQRVENLFADTSHNRLVSTSTDGTVRIWSATDGKLLKTLVLPIFGPEIAVVEKAGLSPHGNLLAVGLRWDSDAAGNWVALYDLNSGAPPRMHRISGQVSAVAFSEDEHRVAIATWKQVNVYRLPEFEVIATDLFPDVVWSLDFDPTGRLVAGSFDGQVRLYDKDRFWPIAKMTTSAGKQITNIKFSPDGSHIAVGFNTGSMVEILSAEELKQVTTLKPTGAEYDEVSRVAWSPDGQTVFALATLPVKGTTEKAPSDLLSWRLETGGGWFPFHPSPKSTSLHRTPSSALNFAPLISDHSLDGFAISLWNGDVYTIKPDGQQLWHSPAVKAYLDEPPPTDLLVSEHGDVVSFARGGGKDQGFCIDLRIPALTAGSCGNAAPRPPLTAPSLDVAHGTVNGNDIDLDRWETIEADAIAPDKKSFVLGTRMGLRGVGLDGKSLWEVDPGSEVWAVNISGDGRFAIAALGDGRLGWYDMATGHPLLSVFIHADGARWAAWTPDGRFYAPPDSRALVVGVARDRPGTAVPTPISAGALIATYYRPDLLASVLGEPQQPK